MSRVSTHAGQNRDVCLSAHGRLTGTLRYFNRDIATPAQPRSVASYIAMSPQYDTWCMPHPFRYAMPQISQRKLLLIFENLWNSRKFSPSKVSRYMALHFKGQCSNFYRICISVKCPCGPKSRVICERLWVLTWDTMVMHDSLSAGDKREIAISHAERKARENSLIWAKEIVTALVWVYMYIYIVHMIWMVTVPKREQLASRRGWGGGKCPLPPPPMKPWTLTICARNTIL